MKIISPRQRINNFRATVNFNRKDVPGAGFSFDCDKSGKPIFNSPLAEENYKKCVNGEFDVTGPFYTEMGGSYIQPAIGICDDCNEEVELHGFTNTCECGTDYNMSGQKLASREFWGDDTGESLSDILMIK